MHLKGAIFAESFMFLTLGNHERLVVFLLIGNSILIGKQCATHSCI